METIGEKCGVFGIYGQGLDVSRLTFFGLYSLQHRGQESSGIAVTDGQKISCYKNAGLVAQVFNEEIIKQLDGADRAAFCAIGHNRYSTSSGADLHHVQPVIAGGAKTCRVTEASATHPSQAISEYFDEAGGKQAIALAHNGNLPSVKALTDFLESKGVDLCHCAPDPCFKDRHGAEDAGTCITPSDSTLITEALAWHVGQGLDIEQAVEKVWPLMTGSFSILIMTKDKLIALRDGYGIRPFSVGKLNGGYVFASETCAFHPIGATFIRDVLPGEMVVVDAAGLRSKQIVPGIQKLDIFEFVYFARPDSRILGKSVYDIRKSFGKQLAAEYKIKADVVIPVPETAIPVAIGYAAASGIPFEMGLVKSRYIHRTFIEPEQHIREQGVKLKLAPLKEVIEGKSIIIVDDSVVRGTTSKKIIKMLFEAGAKEVHFVISSPPVKFPDFYGIDLATQKELFATGRTIAQMNEFLGSTSLNFLSYDGMIKATGLPEDSFCTSCFSGEYPIDLKERLAEVKYEQNK